MNVVGSCGDGPNSVFSQAEHSVKVVLESLTRRERGVKSDVVKDASGRKKEACPGGKAQLTCLTVALKAPKMAAAPPQSLFIPGMVV